MATTIALSGTLLTGPNTFGPITPPAGTTVIQAAIDRANLALLTKQIDLSLELSIDGGSTWRPWGGGSIEAGTIIMSAGINGLASTSALTESTLEVGIPSADSNTRLRGAVTTRETVITTVTVRMS